MRGAIDWYGARLRATRDLCPDVRQFEIAPDGVGFLQPTPGSHIEVAVDVADRPAHRSYSLVGPYTEKLYRIAVKRLPASRGGSAGMWRLVTGDRLRVSRPANDFALRPGQAAYLLVAGGIGITALHAMALALAAQKADFRLLYGVRRRQDLAFADDLGPRIGSRLQCFVGEEGRRIDIVGEVERLAPQGEAYVCGPMSMLEAFIRAWRASGRPADRLRFETFGSGGAYAAQPFTVKIPRLGRRIEVAQNQTMLEALESAGIAMISDCRRGECGLCALDILSVEGIVDHRDIFFSDDEKTAGRKLCTCVSRVAGGSITVDTPDRLP